MKLKGILHFAVSYICIMLDNLLKFIFPKRCVICDTVLPYGDKLYNMHLCDECKNNIEFIKEPTCKKCGAMIDMYDEAYCSRCKEKLRTNFEYGFGLCRYNDFVKESLHRIKYVGRKEYIEFYGKCIAKVYKDKFLKINPDCFIPVPIHRKRLIKRNYNQAKVLANAISDELAKNGIDIPVDNSIIKRVKNTKVLNKLGDDERKNELQNAFTVYNTEGINTVVLVDDIYTTGETIDNISKILRQNGINKVFFVVISVLDNL